MKNKIKHAKIKNVGILFEMLTRQITTDVLNGNEKSKAIDIIKKYFNSKSIVGVENQLYQSIFKQKVTSENSAEKFLDTVVEAHQKINKSELRSAKYNLIKEIKDNYDLEYFLKSSISNYKVYASAYKVFKFKSLNESVDPNDYFDSRNVLIQHIYNNSNTNVKKEVEQSDMTLYEGESKDVRLLTYKLLVDKFNAKYKTILSESQKKLLRNYINNISNTTTLCEYIKSEVPVIKKSITTKINKISNDVVKIKLKETVNQLDSFNNIKLVKDSHVATLMKYYELINELDAI